MLCTRSIIQQLSNHLSTQTWGLTFIHLHYKQLVKNAKITYLHHKCHINFYWLRYRIGFALALQVTETVHVWGPENKANYTFLAQLCYYDIGE